MGAFAWCTGRSGAPPFTRRDRNCLRAADLDRDRDRHRVRRDRVRRDRVRRARSDSPSCRVRGLRAIAVQRVVQVCA